MGWFGWPAAIALATDVNHIQMAMRGRIDLLAMMGLAKPLPNPHAGKGASPGEWRDFTRRHNLRHKVEQSRPRRAATKRGQ